MSSIQLIVGLGNPGARYASTRHNVGFWALEALVEGQAGIRWDRKFKGELVGIEIAQQRRWLLKPQTYMNLSAQSVQAACAFYRIHPTEMLVVHDDIDLELGRIMAKQGGGHGGHNGLRSIIEALGPDFARLRLGVGRPAYDAAHHVLSPFAENEVEPVDAMIERAAKAVTVIVREGMAVGQNRVNRRATKKQKKKKGDDTQPNDAGESKTANESPISDPATAD